MSTFDPTRHDREPRSGKFSAMVHSVGRPLSVSSPLPANTKIPPATFRAMVSSATTAQTHGAQIIPKRGATNSESRRLLQNIRGEKDGKVRLVHLDVHNAPARAHIIGPEDGRPIAVSVTRVPAGVRHILEVRSGKAVISTDTDGSTIEVADGAHAIIIAPSHRRVNVEVAAGGKATLVSESEDNGFNVTGAPSDIAEVVVPVAEEP